MVNLNTLFALKNGGVLTKDETKFIDSELALACSADIPDDQVENAVDYLNSTLLHNGTDIPADQFAALEKLRFDLEDRR
jgi:hypothetical protein